MIVKDIMTPVVEVLRGYEFLDQAAHTMKRLGMNCLPVIDHNKIVGILTAQSIDGESAPKGLDLTRTQVRNVMMAGDMTCDEHLTIQEIAQLLERMHKSCLVVLNRQGQSIGIVSQENISRPSGFAHCQS